MDWFNDSILKLQVKIKEQFAENLSIKPHKGCVDEGLNNQPHL